jgi:hypothetical protein
MADQAGNQNAGDRDRYRVIEALDFDVVPSRMDKAKHTFDTAPVDAKRHAVRRGLSPAAMRLRNDVDFPVTDYPLTAEQLAAANLLLDFSDSRSQAAKLKEIGVSTTKYNNWLRNPEFAAYLRERAEQLVDNTGHEAHTALLKQVQRGNMSAITYYNQMTGRFTPGQEQQMNVAAILVRVVEAVQRHVKDPEVIRAIATEFNDIIPTSPASPVERELSA